MICEKFDSASEATYVQRKGVARPFLYRDGNPITNTPLSKRRLVGSPHHAVENAECAERRDHMAKGQEKPNASNKPKLSVKEKKAKKKDKAK